MIASLSTDVYPELIERLCQHGLVTSIKKVAAKRLERELRKPAMLLHKGWNYVAGDQPNVVTYRLGEQESVHQVLRFFRSEKRVELVSADPLRGCHQLVELDLDSQEISENLVSHESGQGSTRHRLGLDGKLHRENSELAA